MTRECHNTYFGVKELVVRIIVFSDLLAFDVTYQKKKYLSPMKIITTKVSSTLLVMSLKKLICGYYSIFFIAIGAKNPTYYSIELIIGCIFDTLQEMQQPALVRSSHKNSKTT
ncbi:hypothetical protein CR513_37254, partial [Mucuna pruriens]